MENKPELRGSYLKNKTITEVSERVLMVTEILKEFKELKAKFEGISDLAQAVSKSMMKKNVKIAVTDKSLIKRKSAYRSLLDGYLDDSFSVETREQELLQMFMIEQLKNKSADKKIKGLIRDLSVASEQLVLTEDESLSRRTHGTEEKEDTKSFCMHIYVL
jgi:hypothetical protein